MPPKAIVCVACGGRTTPNKRVSLKGAKLRENVGRVFNKHVDANSIICKPCYDKQRKGTLKSYCKTKDREIEISVFYIGSRSHNFCTICNKKSNNLCTIPAAVRTSLFVRYGIVVSTGARCCRTHLNGSRTTRPVDNSARGQLGP